MNKNKFAGLILMMLLSTLGIIWVQIFWIRKAVGIRNDSFNNAVAISLNNTANSIETSRKLNFFNNFMLGDPRFSGNQSGNLSGFLSIDGYSSQDGDKISVHITQQSVTGDSGKVTTIDKSYIISGDSSVVLDSSMTVVPVKKDPPDQLASGKPGSPPRYINQNEFMDWVRKRSNEFRNMSDRMISEIYQWEKTMDINKNDVEYALGHSLAFSGIQTPYEYALIKNGTVEEGTFKKTSKKQFLESPYKVRLFPDNIIRQDLVLSVVFPGKTGFVLGSMAWILGGSMLFSLFILATFALSLYFLISQKKISEMKSDFINNMTHEFKTPIATISLAADTITNPKVIKDENSIRHFIGMIKKENNRMNKKVETILQIAYLDKKEIEFKFENVSMHAIVEHAIDTIDIQVQQRNGKIHTDLAAEEPVVYGDSEHLTNLVNNLLDNAIKYSPDAPEITVTSRNKNSGLVLTVEDKGIGMTKAVQSKIFERFYRQSSGNVHDVKGFGLGLNYVRAIIEAHRGDITVSSEPGKGSRFEVYLPFNWEN